MTRCAPRSVGSGRIASKHRPLRHQRNYAEVLIKVSPTDGFAKVAAAKIIGHYFEEVNVIVGPIVGKVTSHSAVVLVEVDAQAPVTAILVDSLSGAERRQLRLLPSRQRPRTRTGLAMKEFTHPEYRTERKMSEPTLSPLTWTVLST